MKDSRWDKFKNFVSKIATVLDTFADLLGWIAVAVMVIAIWVPGLNVLILSLILVALALHSLLAVTGNGSWVDVAFDVVALATFGVGQIGSSVAKAGRAATLTRAGNLAGREAAEATLARASYNGGRGFLGGVSKFFNRLSPGTRAAMRTSADDAAREWTTRALPHVRPLEVVRNGFDRELATLARDRVAIAAQFGDDFIAARWNAGLTIGRGAAWTGLGTDTANISLDVVKLGDNPVSEVYQRWERDWTTVIGGPF